MSKEARGNAVPARTLLTRDRYGESRSTSVRRHRIHRIFVRDRFTNCHKLACELEVAVRTVLRDIEAMRNQDYPIEYDPRKRAYFYSDPVYNLPSIQISEMDAVALRVACQSCAHDGGMAFHQRLGRIWRIFLNGVRKQAPEFNSYRVANAFSSYDVGIGIVAPAVFLALTHAVLCSEEVVFNYRKPGEPASMPRRVRPLSIANRDNLPYLVAEESARGPLKCFAVSRIEGAVEFTGRKFAAKKPPRLATRFRNSFRAFAGDSIHRVKLRFSRLAAPYVAERRWHSSQTITELPNGGISFEVTVSDLRDIRSWILRWGPEVEVLEPSGLRQTIATAVKKAAEIYHAEVAERDSIPGYDESDVVARRP